MMGRLLVSQTNFSNGISCELRITKLILSTVFYISSCPGNTARQAVDRGSLMRGCVGDYFLEFLASSSDGIIDPCTNVRMPTLKDRSIILPCSQK